MHKTLHYLFDPLCGWCYGKMPTVSDVLQTPGIAVKLLPSGLFSGEGARLMGDDFAAYAWSNDQRIERLTGQRFSEQYRRRVLGAHQRLIDSGPATVALTAVSLTATLANPDAELLSSNGARVGRAQALMREFGARGVPTMIIECGARRRVLDHSAAYSSPRALISQLEAAEVIAAPIVEPTPANTPHLTL